MPRSVTQILLGICGLTAHLSLTTALSIAPASVVAPMDFARLPVIAVVGLIGCIVLVFALPTAIVASGLAVLLVGVGVRQIGLRLG